MRMMNINFDRMKNLLISDLTMTILRQIETIIMIKVLK